MKSHLPEHATRSIPVARTLRKRMTDPEKLIWSRLRNGQFGMKFRRQVPLGPYIVDLYCTIARMAVELDGRQHHAESGLRADFRRDSYLDSIDIKVARYTNSEVLDNTDSVIHDIDEQSSRRLNSACLEGANKD